MEEMYAMKELADIFVANALDFCERIKSNDQWQ